MAPNNHPFLDDLTDRIKIIQKRMFFLDLDETVVNNVQNWMMLIIQIRMKVAVVNIIQNWMTLIIQIRVKVTVVNKIG